jgi:hypothetical protein
MAPYQRFAESHPRGGHHNIVKILDRYLFAVKQHLPKAQQNDIVAELSDEIASAMEDEEAKLGRAMTIDEQSAILKNYGPPPLAAARYLKHQYLIGPALFPFYVSALKAVLSIAFGVALVAAVVAAISAGRIGAFLDSWSGSWMGLFSVAGIVTLIFAIWERAGAPSQLADWNPRKLPVPQAAAPISRVGTGIDMLFNLLFVSWVMDFPGVRNAFWHLASGGYPAALGPLSLAPVWHLVLNVFVAIAVVRIVQGCINLVRPDWIRLRAATMVVVSVASACVFAVALRSATFVSLVGTPVDRTNYAAIVQALNILAYWCCAAGIAIALVCAILNAIALCRRAPLLGSPVQHAPTS